MKRALRTFAALAAIALLATAATAGDEATPAGGKKDRAKAEKKEKVLRGRYAGLVKQLDLTADQQAKLTELVKQHNEAMKAWKDEHGEQLKELQTQFKQAKTDGDKEQAKQLREQMKALSAERAKAEAEHWKQVMGLLTPEQVQAWHARQFEAMAMRLGRKVDLTDDQKARISELAKTAAARTVAATDAKAGMQAKRDFHQAVMNDVLTDEQRAKLKQPGRARDQGEHKEKPKRRNKKADDAGDEMDDAGEDGEEVEDVGLGM